MRKQQPIRTVAIIGPGRMGQAMGRLLAHSRVPIAFIAARDPAAARRAVRFIGKGIPTGLSDPRLQGASVVLISTSDSAIAQVARDLARLGKGEEAWRGKVVLHVCGSLPSAVLRPLQLRGAAIGSLHPFQTVPSPQAGVRNLRGCFWAVEGDRRAVRLARSWIKLLGVIPFSIGPEAKTLYHLSAFIVCPTVVTLMAQAAALLKQAGVPSRISRPMLRQFVSETAKNFADMGGRWALTGPAVRGDWATIRRHLSALRHSAPEFEPVYKSLLEAMLTLAGGGQHSAWEPPKQVKRQSAKGKTE